MTGLQGILFDVGDTLLDFGPVDTIDLFEQGARLTYAYLRDLDMPLPSFRTYYRRQLRAIRWAYLKSHVVGREFNSMDILRRIAQAMGHDLTAEQFAELAWLWYEPLSHQATVEPHLPEVLAKFTEDGLKLGVISNTFIPGTVLDRHLASEGLLGFLPIRVYSCDARYRKPHPKIFHRALVAGCLAPHRTLFVGDSPRADVLGARKSGMIAVLKDPTGERRDHRPPADHNIRSLTELEGIIKQYRPQAP